MQVREVQSHGAVQQEKAELRTGVWRPLTNSRLGGVERVLERLEAEVGRPVDDSTLRSPSIEGRTALYLIILSFPASGSS